MSRQPEHVTGASSTPAKRPASLLTALVSGSLSALIQVTFGFSLAAMIFAGKLAPHMGAGIAMVLTGSGIIATVIALFSGRPAVLGGPQDSLAVVLSLVVATVAAKIPDGEDPLPTVFVVIAGTSLVTGAFLYLLGRLRMGRLVRFLPFPVVGGFIAGVGWLLIQGAASVLVGDSVTLSNLGILVSPGVQARLIPGLLYGAVIAVVLLRDAHFLVLPGLIVGGIVAFYVVLFALGISIADASARGWLLGPFHAGGLWPAIHLHDLTHVHWDLVRGQFGSIAAAAVLAAVTLLLNASALELATDEPMDLDHELRVNGASNILSGLAGGAPGFMDLPDSVLAHKLGSRSRIGGLVVAVSAFVTLFAGASALSYFPQYMLGGLLFCFGVPFLVESLWDGRHKLSRREYGVMIAIFLVVVTVGFLEGVVVGLVISTAVFALEYGRTGVLRRDASGALLRSRTVRDATDSEWLDLHGATVRLMQLQGYVFFGTAWDFQQRVQAMMTPSEGEPLRALILDFHHVTGIDSSAVQSFARIRKAAQEAHVTLVLAAMPPDVRDQLERGEVLAGEGAPDAPVRVAEDSDRALEWTEEQLLLLRGTLPEATVVQPESLRLAEQLGAFRERIEAPADATLFRQGDTSRDIYVLESGQLEIVLELPDGRTRRLGVIGPGAFVGEAALYRDKPRSATVRATTAAVLYRWTPEALARMEVVAPASAVALHAFMARMQSDRLVQATSAARMLLS